MKQIDNYRLDKQIGKGATAIVYEGVDDKTNQLVAAKAIPAEKLVEKRSMDNFMRELNLLHRLNHENIIKVLGLKKTSRFCYIFLEYCNGGNLYEYKCFYEKKKKMTINELFVQKILRQLICGLEHMHNNNTIHRDIKLENILLNFNSVSNTVKPGEVPHERVNFDIVSLNDDFTVKIADLGFARDLDIGGVASTICGTPITMAPDVANLIGGKETGGKDNRYNTKADLWSLGAITYELLIGKSPFYASDYHLLFQQLNEGKYTLPKKMKLSIEAISFINGLLQFYPENRMSWTEIKKHPFIQKSVEEFHFIDLRTVDENSSNAQTLEMNTKNCDNFLWLKFKNSSFNMELDKVNDNNIKDPKIQKLINEKKTVNEDIMKEVEEEKKRIEGERLKIHKEREEAEKIRLDAEKIRKEVEQLKKMTEEERAKLHKEDQERLNKLEEEKRLEQERKKADEILRQQERETLDKERKRILEEKKRSEELRLEAENQLRLAEKMKQEADQKTNEILNQKKIDESKRKEEEHQRNIDDEKRKADDKRLNEELTLKELQHREEEEKLKQELLQMKQASEKLRKEVEEKTKYQKELEEKEKEKEILQAKIQQITNENEKKIAQMENERKERELQFEQEKQLREQEALVKKEKELKENIQNKEKELKLLQIQPTISINHEAQGNLDQVHLIDLVNDDQWECISSKSEEIDYTVEEKGKYEIIGEYFSLD